MSTTIKTEQAVLPLALRGQKIERVSENGTAILFETVAEFRSSTDAEDVFRKLNSHTALVEALRGMVDAWETGGSLNDATAKAKSALALAEKKEGRE